LSIPRRWHTWLFKKRWFRSLRISPESEDHVVEESDITDMNALQGDLFPRRIPLLTDRTISYTYGPVPLDDEIRNAVELAEKAFMISYKRKWDGVAVRRNRERIRSSPPIKPLMRVGRGFCYGRRLWIRAVYDLIDPESLTGFYYPERNDAIIEAMDDPRVHLYRPVVLTRNDRPEFAPIIGSGFIRELDGVGGWSYRKYG